MAYNAGHIDNGMDIAFALHKVEFCPYIKYFKVWKKDYLCLCNEQLKRK